MNEEKNCAVNAAVNSPSHYTDGGIETIDYIYAKLSKAEFIGYCRGNVLKYLSREGKKDDAVQDCKKAATYLRWMINVMEGKELEKNV